MAGEMKIYDEKTDISHESFERFTEAQREMRALNAMLIARRLRRLKTVTFLLTRRFLP